MGKPVRNLSPPIPVPTRCWLTLRELAADFRAARANPPEATFLVSYPKSGITWTRFLLAQVMQRSLGLETELTIDIEQLTRTHCELPLLIDTHDGSQFFNEDGHSIDPQRMFCSLTRQRYAQHRVILLVRDPRDIVVSFYHQATRRTQRPLSMDISTFVRDPLRGIDRCLWFYSLWYRLKQVPSELLLVRYEDMLQDCPFQLTRILQFLNLTVSNDLIAAACEAGQADRMRQQEQRGLIAGMRQFGFDRDALKVRQARSGQFARELSPEDVAFCNKRMSSLPAFYGYADLLSEGANDDDTLSSTGRRSA